MLNREPETEWLWMVMKVNDPEDFHELIEAHDDPIKAALDCLKCNNAMTDRSTEKFHYVDPRPVQFAVDCMEGEVNPPVNPPYVEKYPLSDPEDNPGFPHRMND